MLQPGFRPHASGLLVPNELSREREVWCKAEWRKVDAAIQFLTSKGIQFALGCGDPKCTDKPLKVKRNGAGERMLECGHKTRVFAKL